MCLVTIKKQSESIAVFQDTPFYLIAEIPKYSSTVGDHLGLIDSTLITLEGIYDFIIHLPIPKINIAILVHSLMALIKSKCRQLCVNSKSGNEGFVFIIPEPITDIRINNLIGQEMPIRKTDSDLKNLVIDVVHFNPGIYFITINHSYTMKFLKINQE